MGKNKRKSFYDPNYVSERDNISIEEAKKKIDEMKANKATSLKGFIKRHGKKVGHEKFEKFKESSKHTLKKYIRKYGKEIGTVKFNEYISKKDSTSLDWALKKTNGDVLEAKELYDKRKKDLSITFDMDYFIKKHGKGNAEKEMKRFLESKDSSSYKWALKKADGDFKLADEIYQERCENKSVTIGKASKESLKIFSPLVDWLVDNGVQRKEIHLGIKGNHELCIYNKKMKKRYYYDFCIKNISVIIEYNGEAFHPNYEKYSIEYLKENWKHPYINDIDLKKYIKKDKEKINNAIVNEYDIFILWSSNAENEIDKIKKIIKNKLNKL